MSWADDIQAIRDVLPTPFEWEHDPLCQSLFADPKPCNCTVARVKVAREALDRIAAALAQNQETDTQTRGGTTTPGDGLADGAVPAPDSKSDPAEERGEIQ